MIKQNKMYEQNQEQIRPVPLDKSNTQKLKTEEKEVAGRHRNTGQKDHKGNR